MRKALILLLAFSLLVVLIPGCGNKKTTTQKKVEDTTNPDTLKYVETHVHLRAQTQTEYDEAANVALSSMDQLGIMKSLFLPPPRPADMLEPNDYQILGAVVSKNPSRFGFLAGGGSLNPLIQQAVKAGEVTEEMKQQFRAKAEEIARSGAIGYGEMTAEHFSFDPTHPYMSAPPDHPLFLLLADIAAEKNLPIDIHMEAVPQDNFLFPESELTMNSQLNPETLNGNLEAFKRLLAYNRKTRFIWDHSGWDNTGYRTVALMRQFLQENPNLYTNLKDRKHGFEQNRVLLQGVINAEWLQLFKDYPDRVVFGSDMFFYPPGSQQSGSDASNRSRMILNQLPIDLARKLAYENAGHLFGIEVTAQEAQGNKSYEPLDQEDPLEPRRPSGDKRPPPQ